MIGVLAAIGASVNRVFVAKRQRLVKVDDMTALGSGAHLVVVSFGRRQFLLAISRGHVTTIAEDLL